MALAFSRGFGYKQSPCGRTAKAAHHKICEVTQAAWKGVVGGLLPSAPTVSALLVLHAPHPWQISPLGSANLPTTLPIACTVLNPRRPQGQAWILSRCQHRRHQPPIPGGVARHPRSPTPTRPPRR